MKRIKILFCSPCLNRRSDNAKSETTFNQSIDVSHLATPHITSIDHSSTPSPSPQPSKLLEHLGLNSSETNSPPSSHDEESKKSHFKCRDSAVQLEQPLSRLNIVTRTSDQTDRDIETTSSLRPNTPQNSQPSSPPHTALSSLNNNSITNHSHDHQQASISSQRQPSSQHPPEVPPPPVPSQIYSTNQQPQQQQQSHQPQQSQRIPQQPSPQYLADAYSNGGTDNNGTTTRLSYDIISVREPLAKILAERQLMLLTQQQQRQAVGDHEYIEVYGERGSSCFYEEIAGSVTSSATYDQIGAVSNHNYQALINAYAVASRPLGSNQDNNEHNTGLDDVDASEPLQNQDNENVYDVTVPVAGPSYESTTNTPSNNDNKATSNHHSQNDTSKYTLDNDQNIAQQENTATDTSAIMSQSIPVYSVINKATRRSNSIIRAAIDNNRPPRPPPKNLIFLNNSTNSNTAIRCDSAPGPSRVVLNGMNQSSTTYAVVGDKSVSPKPPPRLSKQQLQEKQKQKMSTNDRPLPRPVNEGVSTDNNNSSVTTNKNLQDEAESASNGYESLRPGLVDDDQMDVGYEKIRESNRYSGGSLSSQFCSLQVIDNGGYESVQPIYSSPSNALAEPNYEAIGPATASELAAAATAKLTAAATVIEQILKQDQ